MFELSDGPPLTCEDVSPHGRPSRGRAGQDGRKLVPPGATMETACVPVDHRHPPITAGDEHRRNPSTRRTP